MWLHIHPTQTLLCFRITEWNQKRKISPDKSCGSRFKDHIRILLSTPLCCELCCGLTPSRFPSAGSQWGLKCHRSTRPLWGFLNGTTRDVIWPTTNKNIVSPPLPMGVLCFFILKGEVSVVGLNLVKQFYYHIYPRLITNPKFAPIRPWAWDLDNYESACQYCLGKNDITNTKKGIKSIVFKRNAYTLKLVP